MLQFFEVRINTFHDILYSLSSQLFLHLWHLELHLWDLELRHLSDGALAAERGHRLVRHEAGLVEVVAEGLRL